jgi:hypothetical protein
MPERGNSPLPRIFERLEREIHGLMVDLGLDEQRRDEFLDQEGMVKRFMAAWEKAVEKIEEKVIKQIEAGKEVSF